MTISRVNSFGWALGHKFASAHANALDLNTTYGLDKRSGETDTLGSVVSCTGSGRIIEQTQTGPNGNATIAIANGRLVDVPTLTGSATYVFSNAGAVLGDLIKISLRASTSSSLVIKDATTATLATLSGITANGVLSGANGTWAEFLFNGSQWVLFSSSYNPINYSAALFNSSSSYVVPATIIRVLVLGFGGGGGGGSGANGLNAPGVFGISGGGGGGSTSGARVLTVTPGETLAVTVGSGGPGAASGGGAKGSDGQDSKVVGASGTVTFVGAQGGGGYNQNISSGTPAFNPGGASARNVATSLAPYQIPTGPTGLVFGNGGVPAYGLHLPSAGMGGVGRANEIGGPGAASLEGFGTSPIVGGKANDSGSYLGGGGGGSGGGGPAGQPGNGGNGGVAASGGLGGSGTAGGSAAANTGAGGGGGGAGGCGSSGGGTGGAGGNGGSGQIIIIPLR